MTTDEIAALHAAANHADEDGRAAVADRLRWQARAIESVVEMRLSIWREALDVRPEDHEPAMWDTWALAIAEAIGGLLVLGTDADQHAASRAAARVLPLTRRQRETLLAWADRPCRVERRHVESDEWAVAQDAAHDEIAWHALHRAVREDLRARTANATDRHAHWARRIIDRARGIRV